MRLKERYRTHLRKKKTFSRILFIISNASPCLPREGGTKEGRKEGRRLRSKIERVAEILLWE